MNEFFSETQTELFGTDQADAGGRQIADTLGDTAAGEKVIFIRDFDSAGELISFDAYDTLGRRLGSLPEREAIRGAEYLKEHPDMEICGEVIMASGGEFPGCTVRIWAQRVSNVAYNAPTEPVTKKSSPLIFLIPFIVVIVLVAAVGVTFFSGLLSMFGEAKKQLPEMPSMPSRPSLNTDFATEEEEIFVDYDEEEPSSSVTSSEEEKEPEPPVTAEELAVSLSTEEDARMGVTYVKATVKNNSAHPLTSLTLYVNYGGESIVLISTDTLLSGESTGLLESFVMQTGVDGKPTPSKFSATAKVGGDSVYVKYDYKLKEYQVY